MGMVMLMLMLMVFDDSNNEDGDGDGNSGGDVGGGAFSPALCSSPPCNFPLSGFPTGQLSTHHFLQCPRLYSHCFLTCSGRLSKNQRTRKNCAWCRHLRRSPTESANSSRPPKLSKVSVIFWGGICSSEFRDNSESLELSLTASVIDSNRKSLCPGRAGNDAVKGSAIAFTTWPTVLFVRSFVRSYLRSFVSFYRLRLGEPWRSERDCRERAAGRCCLHRSCRQETRRTETKAEAQGEARRRRHRENTDLTSLPLVSVRRHGRATQWKSS